MKKHEKKILIRNNTNALATLEQITEKLGQISSSTVMLSLESIADEYRKIIEVVEEEL